MQRQLGRPLGRALGLTNSVPAFNLAAFIAGQSDGFDYDLRMRDRLFQSVNDSAPAATPSDVIGLAFDQRLWVGKSLSQYAADQPNILPPFVPAGTGWIVLGQDATHIITFGQGSLFYKSDTQTPVMSAIVANAQAVGRAYEFRTVGGPYVSGRVKADGLSILPLADGPGASQRYGVANSTTFDIKRSSANVELTLGDCSLKEVSRYPATQATASFKPKYQADGASFDGTDDNLLTNYFAGSGANFIVAKVTVPPTVAGTRIIVGAAVGSGNRFYLGVRNTGVAAFGCGALDAVGAGPDLRGRTATIGVSASGGVVRLFVDSEQVIETAYTGVMTQTIPFQLGAWNVNGTPANFWPGSIARVVAGREFIDLATFQKISASL